MQSAAEEKFPAGTTTCTGGSDIDPDTGAACTPSGGSQWLGGPSWSYDAAGNRTNNTGVIDTGNRLTAINGYEFTYDADGNLTRKVKPGTEDLQFGWNTLGQMVQASHSSRGTATYGYDAFGRRVRRSAPDGSVIRYLYDGDDLLMEVDGAGWPLREYTYYPGVDRPHSVRISQTGAMYYYATDHPGNVVGLIDGANQLVNEYRYGAWGEPELVAEGVQQPLRYTAREWDATAGLYQVRARWYDPQTGRFVSEDPIGLAGGINLYRYAANNPTNATDPYGLCELWATIRTRYFSDGTTEVEVLGYYWKGDDCGDRGGGGGGKGDHNQCTTPKLAPLRPTARVTYGPNARGVFAPSFANSLSSAVEELNRRGIVPRINSAFRTPGDQARMRAGGSGSNPAARLSLHQAGYAVDINGTRSPQFGTIREVMGRHGFTWGGTFNDPPHFEINPFGRKGTAEYRARLGAAANAANAYHNQCL